LECLYTIDDFLGDHRTMFEDTHAEPRYFDCLVSDEGCDQTGSELADFVDLVLAGQEDNLGARPSNVLACADLIRQL
jgi:hypothetical protein